MWSSLRNDVLSLFDGRPKLQDKVAEFLGREPHPTGAGSEVLRIKSATNRMFEWHPRSRRVYYLRPTGKKTKDGKDVMTGQIIAFDIETHGDAINAVNIWNRGYAEALSTQPNPFLEG